MIEALTLIAIMGQGVADVIVFGEHGSLLPIGCLRRSSNDFWTSGLVERR